MYNKKPNNHCSGLNLDGHPDKICTTPIDHIWAIIVGQANEHNSTNSKMEKLVRVLNKPRVDIMDPSTSRTPLWGFIDFYPSSSHSFV